MEEPQTTMSTSNENVPQWQSQGEGERGNGKEMCFEAAVTVQTEEAIKAEETEEAVKSKRESSGEDSDELSNSNELSEADEIKKLVFEAKNGDSIAYALLAERFRGYINTIVMRMSVHHNEREDLMQEGMIGLLKAVRTYDETKASFSTYAWHCIKNAVLTEVQKYDRAALITANTVDMVAETITDVEGYARERTPEEIYIDRESTKQLYNRIFSVLSRFESAVFEMYLTETPYAVMSKRLGKDVKSIDNAVQRLKTKLKKLV